MSNRLLGLIAAGMAVLIAPSIGHAQASAPQRIAAPSTPPAPAPKRDLSGVWAFQGNPDIDPDDKQSPGGIIPPPTPWAKALYDAEKPGYGRKAAPGGNDPILQCDPIGFPRIMFFPTPFEFIQINGRILQIFERDHLMHQIWTDGREIPKNAADNPLWYGYSVGHWEDDYTLVVETAGLDDRTWLGASGYPHSTSMVVEERYRRVDYDTIQYNLVMTDPVAYTRPWIGATRALKRRPRTEIPQNLCVWSEENSFTERIRMPAVDAPPSK